MNDWNACDEVLAALRRLIRAIDLQSKWLEQRYGLTVPQALVLKKLSAADDMAVGKLAESVSLSQATVTDIVTRLERRGLVERVRSVQDKRRVLVRITAAGSTLLADAVPLLQDSFVRRFTSLADWEQSLLLSSLQRIAAMMDAEALDAAPVLSSGELSAPDGATDDITPEWIPKPSHAHGR